MILLTILLVFIYKSLKINKLNILILDPIIIFGLVGILRIKTNQ